MAAPLRLASLTLSGCGAATGGLPLQVRHANDVLSRYIIPKKTKSGKMSDPEVDQNKIALSVIIPCFNHGNFLLEAVASVESCQEPVYEIIIVNDGSTDALTERVLGYLQEKG